MPRAYMPHESPAPADVPQRVYWLVTAALALAGTALAQCLAHHGLPGL